MAVEEKISLFPPAPLVVPLSPPRPTGDGLEHGMWHPQLYAIHRKNIWPLFQRNNLPPNNEPWWGKPVFSREKQKMVWNKCAPSVLNVAFGHSFYSLQSKQCYQSLRQCKHMSTQAKYSIALGYLFEEITKYCPAKKTHEPRSMLCTKLWSICQLLNFKSICVSVGLLSTCLTWMTKAEIEQVSISTQHKWLKYFLHLFRFFWWANKSRNFTSC